MKNICIIVLMLIIFGYASGTIVSKYYEPTPQECLSVCVEEFERYGC